MTEQIVDPTLGINEQVAAVIANGQYMHELEVEVRSLRNTIRRCQRLAEHCKEDVVPSKSRSQLKEILTLCRLDLRRSYREKCE